MNYVSSNSGVATRELLKAQLWPNQHAAFAEVEKYLAEKSTRQCMIRMPAGSVKTAVFAVLAQLNASHPRVLLIAPWNHLTDQLHGQVGECFWGKSKLQPHFAFRLVRQFAPTDFDAEMGKVCGNVALG